MGLTTFQAFMVVGLGIFLLIVLVVGGVMLYAEWWRYRWLKLHGEGIDVPREVTLLSCRPEVQRIQEAARTKARHIGWDMVPNEACEREYFDVSHPSPWLEGYVRFLRYLDCRIIIVQRRHFDKVNKYIKDLERGAVMILVVVLTSPAVMCYIAAGFSKPYIIGLWRCGIALLKSKAAMPIEMA